MDRQLDGAAHRVLTVVTAPAGAGKTTLVERWAQASGLTVAWCRLTPRHRDREVFASALPSPSELAGMDLLILDDTHTLHGSAVETDLEALVKGGQVPLVLIGRRRLSFDLSRWRLAHEIVELDAEDLRFRSWEIETLFADGFCRPLVPEERSLLERKTNGWAAALQLFHMACAGRTDAERVGLLSVPGFGLTNLREYLTSEILDDLAPPLQSFLKTTAVLPVLTAELCDQLRATDQERPTPDPSSRDLLAELEANNVFLRRLPDGNTFEYHEVFRNQLCMLVLAEHDEAELARRFGEAGRLLAQRGYEAEAIECHARAGQGPAVAALLASAEGHIDGGPIRWLEHLPSNLTEDDPWVLLARARASLDRADLADARVRYEEAAKRFPSSAAEQICTREQRLVECWDGSSAPDPDTWVGALRLVLDRGTVPLGSRRLEGATGAFVNAMAAALSGRCDEAHILVHRVLADPEASARLKVLAEFAGICFDAIFTSPDEQQLVAVADRMQTVNLQWGHRLATAAQALTGHAEAIRSGQLIVTTERVAGRTWVAQIAELLVGIGRLRSGERGSLGLDVLARDLRANGARALGCYALALETVARQRASDPGVAIMASRAELEARVLGLRPAEALCLRVLAIIGERPEADVVPLIERIERDSGIDTRTLCIGAASPDAQTSTVGEPATTTAPEPVRFGVRCLGDLELPGIDPATLKPRVRSLYCRLAAGLGHAVSDERLIEDLWPGTPSGSAKRSLQVAVSSLRRALDAVGDERGEPSIAVLREGGGYVLHVAEHLGWDLAWLHTVGQPALGQPDTDVDMLRTVAHLASLPVFPSEPLADWLHALRNQHVRMLTTAARAAAPALVAQGADDEAVTLFRLALDADRFDDWLWRDYIACLDSLGLRGTALQARAEYDELLRELSATA